MVDVLALVSDEQLADLGLEKNVCGLLDAEQAERLYDAMPAAVRESGRAGATTALSLSDVVCVSTFGDEFLALLKAGDIDVLFGNEAELLALFPDADFGAAVERLRDLCPLAVVTRSEQGSIVVAGNETHEVRAARVGEVVDTTGAGDLYAAGFLFGLTHGQELARCGELGSLCAAEVISHVGARPQRRLAEVVASS